MGTLIDLTDQKFGKLTVKYRVPKKARYAYWFCECECGGTIITSGAHLRRGHTTSCGCSRKTTRADHESQRWLTHDEMNYIENIGTFGRVFISTRKMLENYLSIAKVGSGVDKNKVMEFAKKKLANLEREAA